MEQQRKNIVLAGNPNIGKSSLFNCLTGLRQKVGNFAGVTVEKKTGVCELTHQQKVNILDLPGTYSLYPRREDEWVSYNTLMEYQAINPIDLIIVLIDASNLKRNLLFCSQILDLKLPVIVALTMVDVARQKGIRINITELERELGAPVVVINPRKERGTAELKKTIEQVLQLNIHIKGTTSFIPLQELAGNIIQDTQATFALQSDYQALHYIINGQDFPFLHNQQKQQLNNIMQQHNFNVTSFQAKEILMRFQKIDGIIKNTTTAITLRDKKLFSDKLDNILLHRRYGYIIMFAVLFLLFQSIFWLAQYPMDFIENGFNIIKVGVAKGLPNTWWSSLITDGLLAGIGGILVFIPQIMILFGLLTILEDTGYMARMSFLSDRFMRRLGLNGKSVMPLVGGFACAVPSIMSARSIENKKERLLTIFIAPLISCSARLPVYTVLISLVIPNKIWLGFISLQGLVMTGMYLFGVLIAFLVAFILKLIVKVKEKSIFLLELPIYRAPIWRNVGVNMLQRAQIFLFDAGKTILMISLLLWVLSYFGPSNNMATAKTNFEHALQQPSADTTAIEKQFAQQKLEGSYMGIMGKTIEPIIKPIGYDWKIGISLLTSFAAREVFVGTMATLYSVDGDDEDTASLKEKMTAATFSDGSKVYTLATGISLLVFYAIALQCMSTFATVKRELKSWKWATAQLVIFTVLAYVLAFIAYQTLK